MSTADKLNKLLETKQAIKQAIADKGVEINNETIFADYPAKINTIKTANDVDLSNYVTKDELPTVPTNVSEFNNDAGYLTEHQDISHLALKSEIPEVPSIEGLASEQYVNDAINNIEIPQVDTSNLATKEELNNALGDIESLLGNI